MLFIPLPFLVTVLLLLLLLRMVREGGTSVAARPFFLLTAGNALLSMLIGLRWGYGFMMVLPMMSLLAIMLPPLTWVAFRNLESISRIGTNDWLHAAPLALMLLLHWLLPNLIDVFLVLVFVGYGFALAKLAFRGTDALDRVPLERSSLVHLSLWVTALMLIASGVVDGLIAFDFAWYGGVHAAQFVAVSNIAFLLILGSASAIAGKGESAEAQDDEVELLPYLPSDEDKSIASKIEALVLEKQLFRDPELTLNRLARKALIPARRISSAINRTRNESVSQYINGYRIDEACKLLTETTSPITGVMFESGFQTKSNFNREFLRRTGLSPIEWRAAHQGKPN